MGFKQSYLNEDEKNNLIKSLDLKHLGYGIYKNTKQEKFRWDGNKFVQMKSAETSPKKLTTIDGKIDHKTVIESMNFSKDSKGNKFISLKDVQSGIGKYEQLFNKLSETYENIEKRVNKANSTVNWYVAGKNIATFKKMNDRVYIS